LPLSKFSEQHTEQFLVLRFSRSKKSLSQNFVDNTAGETPARQKERQLSP
jgi:hypothetical protein